MMNKKEKGKGKKYMFETLNEFIAYNIGFERGMVQMCEHLSNQINNIAKAHRQNTSRKKQEQLGSSNKHLIRELNEKEKKEI